MKRKQWDVGTIITYFDLDTKKQIYGIVIKCKRNRWGKGGREKREILWLFGSFGIDMVSGKPGTKGTFYLHDLQQRFIKII